MLSDNYIDNIMELGGKNYRILPIVLYFCYFTLFFGVIYINPEYLDVFRTIMQVFVCVFLIYRFHPYRRHTLRQYDPNIIFSSALFLLVNLGIVKTAHAFIVPIGNVIVDNA